MTVMQLLHCVPKTNKEKLALDKNIQQASVGMHQKRPTNYKLSIDTR